MYTQSNRIGMVQCRFHEDDTPSMGIYENRTHNDKKFYTYHCFGCQAHGNVPRDEVNSWLGTIAVGGRTVLGLPPSRPINRKSKPSFVEWNKNCYFLSESFGFFSVPFHTRVLQFLAERHITPSVAYANNIKASESQDALFFTQTYNDYIVGGQIRWLDPDKKPKILHVDMDVSTAALPILDGARCCMIKSDQELGSHSLVFIAESYCDGLALVSRFPHNPVLTPLSTNINLKQVGALHLMLTELRARGILICFDTDEAGVKGGTTLMKELTKLGHQNVTMLMPSSETTSILKPYDTEYLDLIEEWLHADK